MGKKVVGRSAKGKQPKGNLEKVDEDSSKSLKKRVVSDQVEDRKVKRLRTKSGSPKISEVGGMKGEIVQADKGAKVWENCYAKSNYFNTKFVATCNHSVIANLNKHLSDRQKISSSTSRKPYALEEACTVWERVLIDQKEESTSTDMPLGTAIHNIEITLGKGGQLARAAGAIAKLIAKEEKSATLKLPSGEVRLIPKNCSATVGQVGNVGVNQKSLGRVGSKRWLGKRPVVRGVVMNPVDHPHGGGEGRAPIGRKKPSTPWGYPALGRRSRKRNKYSDNLILRRRSK
ncbi:large ribosomal subunit protein uL2cz/uL2cy-like [Humulus lupulus]|uniref:large ribosomal subunit protein uL2cz/uL2cy-like n=1 Tax=Humulus lupulus TaxID=3486 RepID=UPI002B412344|nr:large ribosomal subunit protein uL2cz/uL2cy-like [Humulus lupulus]